MNNCKILWMTIFGVQSWTERKVASFSAFHQENREQRTTGDNARLGRIDIRMRVLSCSPHNSRSSRIPYLVATNFPFDTLGPENGVAFPSFLPFFLFF